MWMQRIERHEVKKKKKGKVVKLQDIVGTIVVLVWFDLI